MNTLDLTNGSNGNKASGSKLDLWNSDLNEKNGQYPEGQEDEMKIS